MLGTLLKKTVKDEDTWIYVTKDGRFAFVREYPKHLKVDVLNLEQDKEYMSGMRGMSKEEIEMEIEMEQDDFLQFLFPTAKWSKKQWKKFKSNLEEIRKKQTNYFGVWGPTEVIMADPRDLLGEHGYLREAAEKLCEETYPNGEVITYSFDTLNISGSRRFSIKEQK